MTKRVIIVSVAIFLFLCVFTKVYAEVIINEVKYSPTSKQWIEIYNNTEQNIDLTTYRILDSGASVNGHTISLFNNGLNTLPSHGYGVIAKSPEDFGAVSFPVFKSSLNIKVSSDNIVLKDDSGNIVNQVIISGTSPNDNSLQLINGVWSEAVPTPGAQNVIPETIINTGNEQILTITNTKVVPDVNVKPKVIEIPKIKTKILAKNIAFVNMPVEFEAQNIGYGGESLTYGKNYWNFGDGDSKTSIGKSEKFTHTYFYPGQYLVTLQYYSNQYSNLPDAVSKMTVEVVPMNVIISKIGDVKDFFIEISNSGEYEVDISGWKLILQNKFFVFPQNTIIDGNGKIILSPKISGLEYDDSGVLKLLNSYGSEVYAYSMDAIKAAVVDEKSKYKSTSIKKVLSNVKEESSLKINESLTAEAINSTKGENSGSYLFFSIFAILLVASSGAVYFVRKNRPQSPEDNFKILDE